MYISKRTIKLILALQRGDQSRRYSESDSRCFSTQLNSTRRAPVDAGDFSELICCRTLLYIVHSTVQMSCTFRLHSTNFMYFGDRSAVSPARTNWGGGGGIWRPNNHVKLKDFLKIHILQSTRGKSDWFAAPELNPGSKLKLQGGNGSDCMPNTFPGYLAAPGNLLAYPRLQNRAQPDLLAPGQ